MYRAALRGARHLHPAALISVGVETVLVNGQLAVDKGEPTGIAAGQPLLRTPKPGICPI